MSKQRLHVVVRGRVQGVGFRWYVVNLARKRFPSLSGWVKNLPDGSVEVLAEGPANDLKGFLAQLKVGPSGARVEQVEVVFTEPRGGLYGFDVTY